MQNTSVKTADFTRLAKNIAKIGSVDSTALANTASSLQVMNKAISSLSAIPQSATQVTELAKSLGKLGSKSIENAIVNIPKLGNALNGLLTTLSRAPNVSQNVIQMTNAMANLASQGSKVGTASSSMRRALNNYSSSARSAKTSTFSLAATFGKLYANFFLAIRATKSLKEAILSTTEYIEAYNYQAVAFSKIAAEWDKDYEKYGYENAESYGESFQTRVQDVLGKLSGLQVDVENGLLVDSGTKNLGLNIQEITQYASELASVTNSLGQSGEATTAITKSMTMLAGDISSLFNKDYETVANNLQSGLIGQSRALYKYGIDITNATLSQYAYNLGISKSVSEMSQMEKQQLRVLAILDQSKVSWGDLANTINSPSNMLRQFTSNIQEVGMVLGQMFMPILTKVMPIINGVTIAIKRLLVSLASLMGVKIDFESFGQSSYADMEDSLDDVADSYDGVADSAKKATLSLMGFDEINKLQDDTSSSSSSSGSGSGSSIDLTDDINKAVADYEKVWNQAFANMENTAMDWADRVEKALEPITNPMKKLVQDVKLGDWFAAGQDVNEIATAVFETAEKIIDKVDWEKLGEDIGEFLAGLDWVDILYKYLKLKFKIWEAIAKVIKESFKEAPLTTALITCFALLNYTKIGKFIGSQIGKKITFGTAKTVITTGTLKSAWETLVIKAMYAFDALSASTVFPIGVVASVYIASTIFAAKGIKKYLGNDSKLHKWFETEVLGIDEKGYVTTVTADCTRAEEGISKLQTQIDGLKDTVINIDVNDKSSIDEANETLVDTINQKNIANKQFQQVSKDYKKIQSTLEKYITQLYGGTLDEFYSFYGQTNDLSDMTQLYEVLTTIGSSNSKALNQMYEELGTHNVNDIKRVQESYNSLKDKVEDCNNTIAQLSPIIEESISEYEELNDTTYEYTTAATQAYHDMTVNAKTALNSLTVSSRENSSILSESYRNAFNAIKLDGTNSFIDTKSIIISMCQSAGIEGTTALRELFGENYENILTSTGNKFTDIKNIIMAMCKLAGSSGGSDLYTLFNDGIANIPTATRNKFIEIIGQVLAGNIGYDEGLSLIENLMSGFNAKAWWFVDTVQARLREAFTIDADIEAVVNYENLSATELHDSGAANFAKGKIATKFSNLAHANGGFVEEGPFFMNRGEIAGKFGNGKTVVANNEQITDGIKRAVVEGMSQVFSSTNFSQQQNGNIVVQIDGQEVFRTTQKYANRYTAMTGQPAFNI